MEVQRREALSAVKQAVRAYLRHPSPAHAGQVEIAWRHIRQLDSVAQWRQAHVSSVVSGAPSAARRVSHGLGR